MLCLPRCMRCQQAIVSMPLMLSESTSHEWPRGLVVAQDPTSSGGHCEPETMWRHGRLPQQGGGARAATGAKPHDGTRVCITSYDKCVMSTVEVGQLSYTGVNMLYPMHTVS
jgi:hypothetical protein